MHDSQESFQDLCSRSPKLSKKVDLITIFPLYLTYAKHALCLAHDLVVAELSLGTT